MDRLVNYQLCDKGRLTTDEVAPKLGWPSMIPPETFSQLLPNGNAPARTDDPCLS